MFVKSFFGVYVKKLIIWVDYIYILMKKSILLILLEAYALFFVENTKES